MYIEINITSVDQLHDVVRILTNFVDTQIHSLTFYNPSTDFSVTTEHDFLLEMDYINKEDYMFSTLSLLYTVDKNNFKGFTICVKIN